MAKGKLSNTKALTAVPVGTGERTVSIRKIDNGFVVRESTWNDKTGSGSSSEYFSPTAPRQQPLERAEGARESPLRDAIESMRDD